MKLESHSESILSNDRAQNSAKSRRALLTIPKLVYTPSRDQGIIKVGVFAGMRADEKSGPEAAFGLVSWAWNEPAELENFELHVFPLCNPAWRKLQGRKAPYPSIDFSQELWTGSSRPEVRHLESELVKNRYHIIILLQSDADSNGLHGFISGGASREPILKAALTAAASSSLQNHEPRIESSLTAQAGADEQIRRHGLGAPPNQFPKPVEIIFEASGAASKEQQVNSLLSAVKTILAEYRLLLAHAPNL